VVTFTSDVTFHMNGDEIHAFHVPRAHTDGDTIVHFRRANVMHLGDVFFNRMYPFIDAGSGGSWAGTLAAVDKVLASMGDDTRLIPGHGPLAGKADLVAYRHMLQTVGERLQALARDGKSLQDAIAAKPTAEFDEVWGKGFFKPDQFVGMLWPQFARAAGSAAAASAPASPPASAPR
jgi:cyclase